MKTFCIAFLLSVVSCVPAVKKEKFKIVDAPKKIDNKVILTEQQINYRDPMNVFFIIAGAVVLVPVVVKFLSKK